ncbi:MAG: saccharopine dehydrogenase NADP-binding domain-containing protein [Candidatus Dormibacteraeota bacterium]|nr:saccharopine dehydrogenase NADP-binding domain-containing protein [Candidatus Dormibacteraeota bacterium]
MPASDRRRTAAAAKDSGRTHDVIVFGATGFVGQLVAEYLAQHAPPKLRVALAGRSHEKLETVRAGLGDGAARWPLVTADSADVDSLRSMARDSRLVVTTVGPYRAYGIDLVDACVAGDTDYCDLTGEVLFMRESIDRFHEAAKRNGTRIVHACGFDSIPSDLGVLLLHDTVQHDGAGSLQRTDTVVRALKGAPSGGTIASMKGMVDDLKRQPKLRRVAGDPYALSPDRRREPQLGVQSDLRGVELDRDLGLWLGPFVMAAANTRVVRRSNALQNWAYGRGFRYREVMSFGSGVAAPLRAGLMSAGLTGLVAGLAFDPTRPLLDRVLPKPGEGPSAEARRRGFFRFDIHATTTEKVRYTATVSAKGDPGYAATAVMLGETALALVLDRGRLPDVAGVLTPATALGIPLVERLRAAGQTYTASLSSRER